MGLWFAVSTILWIVLEEAGTRISIRLGSSSHPTQKTSNPWIGVYYVLRFRLNAFMGTTVAQNATRARANQLFDQRNTSNPRIGAHATPSLRFLRGQA